MPPRPAAPQVVAGVRLVRRNGGYRQSWRTENANRAARVVQGEEHPVTISHEHDNNSAEEVRNGRLKVVTERSLKGQVPFEMGEGKFSYEDAPNPVNQVGGLIEDQIPVVTSNDFASFVAAFAKRCDFLQAKTDDDIGDAEFHEALELIRSLPDLFDSWEESEQDVERWFAKFDKSKAARMKAAEALIEEVDARYLGTKDLSVKIEVLLKRNDPEWAPRIIYAGNDAFNRVTGPAAMVAMERLQELLEGRVSGSQVKVGAINCKLAYKTTDTALADYLQSKPGCHNYYEGDFSANDKEQRSRVALLTNAWLSKLNMPSWLMNLLLEMQSFRVQNRRFGVVSNIRYQLPTGTTFTTFRNSTYNLTMFAVACARQRISDGLCCVLGDDILACTREAFCVSKWKQVVDRFRMKLKGKSVKLNGEATLLSRRIIVRDTGSCMLPLIGKALARFNARANLSPEMSDSQYVAGKALSYAHEFRHVPFMRDAFLTRYDSCEDKSKVQLSDLTWFTRSSGNDTVEKLEKAIREEKVVLTDDEFLDWLMETYEMGLCDLEDLLKLTVLNPSLEYIEHHAVSNLSIDW